MSSLGCIVGCKRLSRSMTNVAHANSAVAAPVEAAIDNTICTGIPGPGDRQPPSGDDAITARGDPHVREVDTWRGRFPNTSLVLRALLEKAVTAGSELSREERLLYTACEFWAAVAATSLAGLLGSTAGQQMRIAAAAFEEIGSARTARAISRASAKFEAIQSVSQLRGLAHTLEARLLAIGEPVDALIARYAADRVATALTLEESVGTVGCTQ